MPIDNAGDDDAGNPTAVPDDFPYPPYQQKALDSLLAEITTGTIEPLPRDAHDHHDWDRWGADYSATSPLAPGRASTRSSRRRQRS